MKICKTYGVSLLLLQCIIFSTSFPVLENHMKMLYNNTKDIKLDPPLKKIEIPINKSPKQDEDGGDAGDFVSNIAQTLTGVANNVFTDNFKFGNALAESAQILPGDAGETVSGFLNSVAEPINAVVGNPFQQFQEYLDQNFPITTPAPKTPKPKPKTPATIAPTMATTNKPAVSHIYFVHPPPTSDTKGPQLPNKSTVPSKAGSSAILSLATSISSQSSNSNGQGGYKRPIPSNNKPSSSNSQVSNIQGNSNSNSPPLSNPNTASISNSPTISNRPAGVSVNPQFSDLSGGSKTPSFSNKPINSNSNTPAFSNQPVFANKPAYTNPSANSNTLSFTKPQVNPTFSNPPQSSNTQIFSNPVQISSKPVSSNPPGSSNSPTFSNPQGNSNSPAFSNSQGTSNSPALSNSKGNSNSPPFSISQGISNSPIFSNTKVPNAPALSNTISNTKTPQFSNTQSQSNSGGVSSTPAFSTKPEATPAKQESTSGSKFSQQLLNSNKPTTSPLAFKEQSGSFSEQLLGKKPTLSNALGEQIPNSGIPGNNNEVNSNQSPNSLSSVQETIFNSISKEENKLPPHPGISQSLNAISASMISNANNGVPLQVHEPQIGQNVVNIGAPLQNGIPNNNYIQGPPTPNNPNINFNNVAGVPQNINGSQIFTNNFGGRPYPPGLLPNLPPPEDEDDDDDDENEETNNRVA